MARLNTKELKVNLNDAPPMFAMKFTKKQMRLIERNSGVGPSRVYTSRNVSGINTPCTNKDPTHHATAFGSWLLENAAYRAFRPVVSCADSVNRIEDEILCVAMILNFMAQKSAVYGLCEMTFVTKKSDYAFRIMLPRNTFHICAY